MFVAKFVASIDDIEQCGMWQRALWESRQRVHQYCYNKNKIKHKTYV